MDFLLWCQMKTRFSEEPQKVVLPGISSPKPHPGVYRQPFQHLFLPCQVEVSYSTTTSPCPKMSGVYYSPSPSSTPPWTSSPERKMSLRAVQWTSLWSSEPSCFQKWSSPYPPYRCPSYPESEQTVPISPPYCLPMSIHSLQVFSDSPESF